MINSDNRIAVITNQVTISDQVKVALDGLFEVDVYKNGLALHAAMEKSTVYKAIISDDELQGTNGIPLRKILVNFGYAQIPFMGLIDQIDNEQRKLAMNGGIADIFTKPINERALRIRVPYLVLNYNSQVSGKIIAKSYRLPLAKRIFDITFSGLALLMLSPVFLLIAIFIIAESKGPICYYSLRVGSGYRVFRFFKFRSMFTGADAKLKDLSHLNQYNNEKTAIMPPGIVVKELCEFCEQAGSACRNPLYADNKIVCETLYNRQKETDLDSAFIKIKNDPRITRVGNFIRNTSLDELPQLWNVFIGDMS
ncbi:MAG: sugar transferase, partial [Ferruginibacter sp.]